jgi:membrane associated rhomboid family serine protease
LTPLWVLIGINVLIFLATSISSGSLFGLSYSVINQVGISQATFASQPWTIVSAMFAHDGIEHILFNMIALYFFGMYVIALVGEARFFIVYFIGGLVGNIFFLLLNHTGIAVGASGAIFALEGLLVVLIPRLKVMIFPIPVAMDLWVACIATFVVLSLISGVAWEAHLGGLLTGIAAGYFLKWQASRKRRNY